MYVQLMEVPYDSGHWGTRMGRGPGALVAAGAAERLRAAGHAVEEERVLVPGRFPTEIATAFEMGRLLAAQVRAAVWRRRFPLVLSGNCIACLGVLASLAPRDAGIVWLDAHGDFNTPETTRSGLLDGMALATATGRCWRELARSVPGFRPIPPERVLLLGARDLDDAEHDSLRQAGVRRIAPGALEAELPAALDEMRSRVRRVYVHLDLDVLDPGEGSANAFAAPGGLTVAQVEEVLARVHDRLPVGAATLSAYDPGHDADGRVRQAALRLLEALAGGHAPGR